MEEGWTGDGEDGDPLEGRSGNDVSIWMNQSNFAPKNCQKINVLPSKDIQMYFQESNGNLIAIAAVHLWLNI